MAVEIYLVRHAEAAVPDKSIIGGRSNHLELTLRGRLQAAALKKSCRQESIYFDVTYTSPAVRAVDTALGAVCFANNDITPTITKDDDLQEMDQGDWTGQHKDVIYQQPDVKAGFAQDVYTFVPGDNIKGESQQMVANRMIGRITQIYRLAVALKLKRIFVATHGIAIKCLLVNMFDLPKNLVKEGCISNTGVTVLECSDGTIRCTKVNDTAHLTAASIDFADGYFDCAEFTLEMFRGKFFHI